MKEEIDAILQNKTYVTSTEELSIFSIFCIEIRFKGCRLCSTCVYIVKCTLVLLKFNPRYHLSGVFEHGDIPQTI